MRACLLPAVALVVGRGLLGCGSGDEPDVATTSDAGADAHDVGIDAPARDTAPSPYDSAEPPEIPDTELGPVGRCLYESIDWTCRSGHICTLFGKCTPDDAGPSEAGSQPCGIVFCDLEYCRCRTASVSLCDCN